jgi:hypothetical protein
MAKIADLPIVTGPAPFAVGDIQHYHRNPRLITQDKFKELQGLMRTLGDISGVVHNRRSNEAIGGNQRNVVFGDSRIELTEVYDEPDDQGTVAWGYIYWENHKWNYRLVDWNDDQCAAANLAANLGAGEWDWDVFANQWKAEELIPWFNAERVMNMKRDISAATNFLKSEINGDDIIGFTPDGALSRTNNNFDKINRESHNVGMFFGNVMVPISRETYDLVWAFVDDPKWSSRQEAVEALLRAGVKCQE